MNFIYGIVLYSAQAYSYWKQIYINLKFVCLDLWLWFSHSFRVKCVLKNKLYLCNLFQGKTEWFCTSFSSGINIINYQYKKFRSKFKINISFMCKSHLDWTLDYIYIYIKRNIFWWKHCVWKGLSFCEIFLVHINGFEQVAVTNQINRWLLITLCDSCHLSLQILVWKPGKSHLSLS